MIDNKGLENKNIPKKSKKRQKIQDICKYWLLRFNYRDFISFAEKVIDSVLTG